MLRVAFLACLMSGCGFLVDGAPSFRVEPIGPEGGPDAGSEGDDTATDGTPDVVESDGAEDSSPDGNSCTCDLPHASLVKCTDDGCVALECERGWDLCDGAVECEELNTLEHCGACNRHCELANAEEFCSMGECVLTNCDDGFGECDEDPTNGCEELVTYYQDVDGDGYTLHGVTMMSCPIVDIPSFGWSATRSEADDCNDDNRDVHPDQDAFFTDSIVPGDPKSGFDYNCDDEETQESTDIASMCVHDTGGCESGTPGWLNGTAPGCGDEGLLSTGPCSEESGVCTRAVGVTAIQGCN